MSGNKKENTELQYEAERDYVKRFIAEQYVTFIGTSKFTAW